MRGGIGKCRFVERDVTRDEKTAGDGVKATKAFLGGGIAEEDARESTRG